METQIISPYKNIMQYARIQILPHQMNSDIESNMELVLQQKVEKKCNKYGYIDKVHNIESYEDGTMIPENLLGAVTYNVTYLCRICIPIENSILIAQVKGVNPELIIARNGPIIIFIPKVNIDSNMWDISNEFTHKKENTIVKVNDYVKVLIVKKKINQGDIKLKCIGNLLDFSTKEETNKYYGQYIDEPTDKEESNFII